MKLPHRHPADDRAHRGVDAEPQAHGTAHPARVGDGDSAAFAAGEMFRWLKTACRTGYAAPVIGPDRVSTASARSGQRAPDRKNSGITSICVSATNAGIRVIRAATITPNAVRVEGKQKKLTD